MLISDPAVTVITSSAFWLFTFIKIVWTVFGEFRPVAISVCVNTKGTEIGLFTRGTKKGNTNMINERIGIEKTPEKEHNIESEDDN